MMNINAYMDRISFERGYDYYEEVDTMLWEAYEAEDGTFERLCEEAGIDLAAVHTGNGFINGELELNLWIWDHCGE